jgi:5-methylcytosine-specific restriction protein A
MTGRAVEEWIGSSPDAKVPPRVRLRIFERHGGRCHISGRKIAPGEPWELEHVIALCNGGENRESNLAPALKDKHRIKTAADVAERAMIDRKRKAHSGIRPKSKFPCSRDSRFKRTLDGRVVLR